MRLLSSTALLAALVCAPALAAAAISGDASDQSRQAGTSLDSREPGAGVILEERDVRDKIAGAWLGAVIGGAWGRPTEFRYLGRIVPARRVPDWSVAYANRYTYRGESDETYVEIPFLDATLRAGAAAGFADWGPALAATDFPLFFANRRARQNLRAGVPAPLSGDPDHNRDAYDIDFQIESDWIGLALPAQPGAAVDLAWRVGHVTNYGDGVYGGVMIAAMHAAAFKAGSVPAIVEAGRRAVPEGTTYRAMIEDVLRWHARHPGNWKAVWRRLERRWNAHSPRAKRTRVHSEFNIDAKLNGAYVLLGLLYGRGDLARTIRVSMRAGQDSDCNPSNAASVLGTLLGAHRIPPRYRHGIAEDRHFPYTGYTLGRAIEANLGLARALSGARGAQVEGGAWNLPPSPPHPAPFEQWALPAAG
jgi:ADP-ribosylglycohydrolase